MNEADKLDQRVLRWIEAKKPSHAAAVSRWGHHYQDLLDAGRVKVTDRRQIIRDGLIDITDTVVLA